MPRVDHSKTEAGSDPFTKVFKEVAHYFAELEGESSRAAAILAVAALEDELDALLRSKFPRSMSNSQWKKIAGPGPTPFGSMQAKRLAAEAFGFFGPETQTTIKNIATVRNKFAHRTKVRAFDHPQVLELCRKLSSNPILRYSLIENPAEKDIRWNFIQLVRELTGRLSAIRDYVPEIDENEPEPLP